MLVGSVLPQKQHHVFASYFESPNDYIGEEILSNDDISSDDYYNGESVDPALVPIDFEDKMLRNEYEKVFRKEDGTYEVAIYDKAVHYDDQGKWKNINNKLIYDSGTDSFENTANSFKIKFPKKIDDNKQIKYKYGDYSIDWNLLNINESDIYVSDENERSNNIKFLDDINQSIIYKNVMENIDVQYVLSGKLVKENIILNDYIDNFSMSFEYKLKGLVLDNSSKDNIFFIDSESANKVFSFSDLYMIDSNNNISYDLQYEVIDTGNKTYMVTISADQEWLKTATYPVTIDPTLYSHTTSMNITDTYVSQQYPETNFSDSYVMYLNGVLTGEDYYGLLDFDIPDEIMDKTILYSYLYLYETLSDEGSQINIYKNTSRFYDFDVDWNGRPTYDDRVVDYHTMDSNRRLIFDITIPVKEWQSEGISNTYGFTIQTDDSTSHYNIVNQTESPLEYGILKPIISIGYEEPDGLKEYWTYTSQDMGLVGTGYISDYTGNLTWVRNEYSINNEYLSLALNFYYNNSDRSDNIGYGMGWKTNYNTQIRFSEFTETYYMVKPDGNIIHFKYVSRDDIYLGYYVNKYIAEDGSRMMLNVPTYQEEELWYEIETVDEILYTFNIINEDLDGRLTEISNKKNGHDIFVTYVDSSSQLIDYIEDEAGNTIDLTYSSGKLWKSELQLIQTDDSLRSIEQRYYYYDSYQNLNYINNDYRYGTDSDTWTSDYSDRLDYYFNSDHKFIYAQNNQDDYRVTYSYDTNNRVQNVLVQDSGNDINDFSIEYNSYRTIYTDYQGDSVYYTFDNYGHTINILDDYGNSQFFRYSGLYTNIDLQWDNLSGYELVNLNPNYYNNHRLIESSDLLKQNQNELNNHSFEEGFSGWDFYEGIDNNIEYTTTESVYGNYSLALTKSDSSSVYASQTVYLETGTYYITGWIKNDGSSPGSYIDVIGETYASNISKIYSSDGWEKYSLAFYVNSSTSVTIRMINDSYSTAYFDGLQLSQDVVDSRNNAILNNSFEESLLYWDIESASRVYLNETGIMQDILGLYALEIDGDGSERKYASQEITNLVTVGETYMVGAWAKADAVPNKAYLYGDTIEDTTSDGRFFGIEVKFDCGQSEEDETIYVYKYLPFNSNIEDWQYQMVSFDVPDVAQDITISVIYQGEGTAYFDNIQLYHGNNSTQYGYNSENGNLKLIKIEDRNIRMTYDSNNHLASISDDTTSNADTTNIESNLYGLIEEISKNNVRTTFEYNSSYQLEDTYIGYDRDLDLSSQDKWFKNSTAYTTDGQYIYSTTDEFGNTTYTNTDYENGLVESVVDAIGNSQSFEYNAYGDLVLTTAYENGSSETLIASYEYDNQGKLEIIYRDDFYYEFVYNDMDQLLFVRVNDGQTYDNLMSYDYWEEIVDSTTYYTNLLKQQIYGNGDYVSFTYSDEDQIKTISFNGTIRTEYEYDSSGRLALLKDLHNNNIYFYTYYLSGKLEKITDKDGNIIRYIYDESGELSEVKYEIGQVIRGVEYHYNSTTGEYDYTQYNVGSTEITKNYDYQTDSLKRLNKIDLAIGSIKFTKRFTYDASDVDQSMGNDTLRVYRVDYEKNDNLVYYYQYHYDENQNITDIIFRDENDLVIDNYDYYYDGFNQLIRENIKVKTNSGTYERTFVYDYDDWGNITSIKEYSYTTSVPTNLITETQFQYNSTWSDQLTRKLVTINGITIEDISYSYDDSGNPTSYYNNNSPSMSQSLAWDGRSLSGINSYYKSITFKYNTEGLRTQKSFSNSSSNYTVNYILDGDKIIYEDRGNDEIYYTYDIDGTLLSMNYNGNEYFYITDLLGNIIELVDISGNTVVEYKYDAWGNIVYQYDSGLGIDDINPFRYRGYYFDVETGYYYLQSRYYNPEICRFISSDGLVGQLGNIQSHNMYAYCANNPVMFTDSTGEFFLLASIIVGAIVGGTIGGIYSYNNGQDIFAGIISGALIGGAVGAVIGMGSLSVVAGLKSVAQKAVSDFTAYSLFGKPFGGFEDYLVAFAFGGLTKGLNINGVTKFASNSLGRALVDQGTEMFLHGESFNHEKFAVDVFRRSVAQGLPAGSQAFFKGSISGAYDQYKRQGYIYSPLIRTDYSY
jgi:RHS repeat-associated protein